MLARIGLVALGLAVGGLAVARAQQAHEARPLLVGVVDMGAVFKGCKKKDALERRVNEDKDLVLAALKTRETLLEGLRKKVDLLVEGSPEWEEARRQLKVEMKTTDAMRDGWEERLKDGIERATVEIVAEIKKATRELAERDGYDLILKTDSLGWGPDQFHNRVFRAQVDDVLFSKASVDVTQDVLALLNDPKRERKEKK